MVNWVWVDDEQNTKIYNIDEFKIEIIEMCDKELWKNTQFSRQFRHDVDVRRGEWDLSVSIFQANWYEIPIEEEVRVCLLFGENSI